MNYIEKTTSRICKILHAFRQSGSTANVERGSAARFFVELFQR